MSVEHPEPAQAEQGPSFFALLWELLKEPKSESHGHHAEEHHEPAHDDAHGAEPAHH